LGGIWSNMKDQAIRVAMSVMGISTAAENFGEVIEGSLFDRIRKAAERMLAWIDANQDKIVEGFNNFANAAVDFGTRAYNWIKRLVDFFQTGLGKVVLAIIAIVVLALAGAAGSIGAIAALIIGTIVLVVKVWQEGFGLISDLAYLWALKCSIAFNNVIQGVKNMVLAVGSWFASLPGRIWGTVGNLWNIVSGAFAQFKHNALVWARDVIDGIISFFRSLPGRISGILSSIGASAASKIKGILGFQSGGIMPYEGLAYLHKGERVTPSEFVTNNDQGVTVNFYGNINNTADKSLDDIGARIGRQITLSRQGAA